MKPLQGYMLTIPRVLFLDLHRQYIMLQATERDRPDLDTFDTWLLARLKQAAYPKPEKP